MTRLRQAQRRLNAPQVNELAADYVRGATVSELAEQYGVHRTTVLAHLDRVGVPRRANHSKLSGDQLREAAVMYTEGLSTVALGHRFGVNAETVRKALHQAEVTVRPRQGSRPSS